MQRIVSEQRAIIYAEAAVHVKAEQERLNDLYKQMLAAQAADEGEGKAKTVADIRAQIDTAPSPPPPTEPP